MKSINVSFVRRALGLALVLPLLATGALADSGSKVPSAATVVSVANSAGPLEVPGIELSNFGVVDGRIFRGAQPGERDYFALKALGVTTIVDLRLDAKSKSRARAESAGLKYVNIPIDDHKQPTDEHVASFIKLVKETGTEGLYVHCAGGRHRTGSMIAVYRMTQNGWDITKAYDEMLAYDFYTSRGHGGFKTFVEDYYERMTTNPTSVPVAYSAQR